MKEKRWERNNMSVDIQTLKIDRVIFHYVYKRENAEQIVEPRYSENCTVFEQTEKRTLKNRITKSLGNKSHALKMEVRDDGEESVYKFISDYWDTGRSEADFIELSKKMTLSLAYAQRTRKIGDSIAVIVEGHVSSNNNRYVCFIKADIQDGFNIELSGEQQAMKYINNLLLTPSQKLQKMGIFIDISKTVGHVAANDIEAYIFDSNTDANSTFKKAAYFYGDFLGLEFPEDNKMLTHRFYQNTREFINTCEELTPSEKHNLQTALIDYLNNGAIATINPSDFANEYIANPEAVDSYTRCMSVNQIPMHSMVKNLEVVQKFMTKRNMYFENAIRLTAPTEGFNRNIEMTENDEGDTIIKIKGKLIRE